MLTNFGAHHRFKEGMGFTDEDTAAFEQYFCVPLPSLHNAQSCYPFSVHRLKFNTASAYKQPVISLDMISTPSQNI